MYFTILTTRSRGQKYTRMAGVCPATEEALVDIVFVLVVLALYAATHWVVWAVSRLGACE